MNSKGAARGFAGLDTLVSDIGPTPDWQASNAKDISAPKASETRSSTPQRTATEQKGSGIVSYVLGGIALIVLFIVFINVVSRPQSSQSTQSNTTMTTTDASALASTPYPQHADRRIPAGTTSLAAAPPMAQNLDPQREESVPPVGSGLTLSEAQMRYCLSEDIRMQAWQGVLNRTSESAINAFNGAVADYNSRCSHFQYRAGSLARVRGDVEANRQSLMAEGTNRGAQFNNAETPVTQSRSYLTSFDCNKARSDSERLVCNDPELAASDIQLAGLVVAARQNAVNQAVFKEHIRMQWNERERTCHDRECVAQWYIRQREWMTSVINHTQETPATDSSSVTQAVEAPATRATMPVTTQSGSNIGTCINATACAKNMLSAAGRQDMNAVSIAAASIDAMPRPARGDRASARRLNQQALAALSDSHPDAAIELLKMAREADPGDEEIVSNLSYAYSANGQFVTSEDTAVLAIALNPRRTSLWAPLAATLAREHRPDQAIQAMWLAYQFSADRQKTIAFIDAQLAIEHDPEVIRMYVASKQWFVNGIKPAALGD